MQIIVDEIDPRYCPFYIDQDWDGHGLPINGTSRMWTDGLEDIRKEDYEEHTKKLVEAFADLFNDDSDEEDDF